MTDSRPVQPPSLHLDDSTCQRWHPKVTPYRMTVLTTTVCLGTTKAVLTQQGRTLAPITLEWISGVVVFLVLYLAGIYDSEGTVPRFLPWFFKFDCMDLVWSFLSLFAVHRPAYASAEHPAVPTSHSIHPPITLYRILICSMVVTFGMSKAVLSYFGSSTAVTWIDWSLGVGLTTGRNSSLYILGLYEFNSSNIWAPFFVKDQSSYITSANKVILLLISIPVIMLWIFGFSIMIWLMWQPLQPEPITTFTKNIYDVCFRLYVSSFLLLGVGLGGVGLFLSLVKIREKLAAVLPRRLLHALRRCVPSSTLLPTHRIESLKTVRRICTHIILHLLGFALCIIASIAFLGMLSELQVDYAFSGSFKDLWQIWTILSFGANIVVLFGLAITIIYFMIRPLYNSLHGGLWQVIFKTS